MKLLKLIIGILIALPEFVKLAKEIQKKETDKAKLKKIKDDTAKIKEAFKKGDEKLLNEIFKN